MKRLILISFILFNLIASSALAEVVVIVRRQAEASGNYVRICDIARVEGPKDQATEVAKTILGPTPAKGQSLEITRWDIESRLFEMGVMATVSFSGNDMVKVFGGGTGRRFVDTDSVSLRSLDPMPESAPVQEKRLDPAPKPEPARPERDTPLGAMSEDAKAMLGKAVSGYLAGLYKRPDIEVESKILGVSEAVPNGAHEVRVVEAVNGKLPGKATLKVMVRDDLDATPREVMVTADADVFGLAPVAGKKLYRGDVLAGRDVRIARVRMEAGKSYLPPSAKAVEGRQLARNLAPGEAILASEAQPTEAVKRGDIVESFTAEGAWEVRGNAKALGSGVVGDIIKVEDTGTRKKYNARITDRGRVAVLVGSWRTKD